MFNRLRENSIPCATGGVLLQIQDAVGRVACCSCRCGNVQPELQRREQQSEHTAGLHHVSFAEVSAAHSSMRWVPDGLACCACAGHQVPSLRPGYSSCCSAGPNFAAAAHLHGHFPAVRVVEHAPLEWERVRQPAAVALGEQADAWHRAGLNACVNPAVELLQQQENGQHMHTSKQQQMSHLLCTSGR
jgi:hypothetical protein